MKAGGKAGEAVKQADQNVDALKNSHLLDSDERVECKKAISEIMMNVAELIGDRRIKGVDVREIEGAPVLVLQKKPFRPGEFLKSVFSALEGPYRIMAA